jgi:hypothetical protein
MARVEDIKEPFYVAATRRHLFKRPDAAYPRAMEDTAPKVGRANRYSGARLDVPVALVRGAEELGYDSLWAAHSRQT